LGRSLLVQARHKGEGGGSGSLPVIVVWAALGKRGPKEDNRRESMEDMELEDENSLRVG